MLKTLAMILVFIIFIIFIALTFSLFFTPKQELEFSTCVLLQNPKTGAVDCFGCANNHCKNAPGDWTIYEPATTGIPYSCYQTDTGCQLAQ